MTCMPEITPLGWLHTILGTVAIVSGIYTLARYKEITLEKRSGVIYLLTTLVTAATAFGIFQHGGFGPGHALGVATLLALAVGTVAAKTAVFGGLSRHFQALSYSATLLFHCIPAITDGLMRLPIGDPVVTSVEDPLLKKCYLVLAVLFLIGISLQLRWISRHDA